MLQSANSGCVTGILAFWRDASIAVPKVASSGRLSSVRPSQMGLSQWRTSQKGLRQSRTASTMNSTVCHRPLPPLHRSRKRLRLVRPPILCSSHKIIAIAIYLQIDHTCAGYFGAEGFAAAALCEHMLTHHPANCGQHAHLAVTSLSTWSQRLE